MTRTKTSTGKYNGPSKQSQAVMRDISNSFACASDGQVLAAINSMAENCLAMLYETQARGRYAELWTDGSWNQKAGAAGIGIVVKAPDRPMHAFGKTVKANGSEEAEIYAMAVGLSYLLDTCPDIPSVRLRYDCASASVSAANIDAYSGRGAPYTNFRSAMKRCRKAGITVLFQHAKAHSGIECNETCDLLAKHYAKIRLLPEQMDAIRPYIRRAADPRNNKQEKR